MMPWVKVAVVKQASGRTVAKAFDRAEETRRIETSAREAVQELKTAMLPFPAGRSEDGIGLPLTTISGQGFVIP